MYSHTLKSHGEIFAEAQAITGSATLGNKNAMPEAGGHLAGLAVSLLASGPVIAAAASHVLIAVETSDSAEPDGFKPLISYNTLGVGDFAAGFKASDGQKIACLPLPEAARYLRVKLSGDGITGTVDCILEYIPR